MSTEQSTNTPEQEFAYACLNEDARVDEGTAHAIQDAFTSVVVGVCEYFTATTPIGDSHPFALGPSDG